MKKLFSIFSHSQGLKQSAITIIGNAIATGFSALAIILLSRFLGPSKFGEFSTGFSVLMLMSRFADFGITVALHKTLPNTKNKKDKNILIKYALQQKIKTSSVSLILALILALLAQNFGVNLNWPIVYLAIFLSTANFFYDQIVATLQALHRFSQAVLANAIQAITKLSFALFFLLIKSKNEFLIFAMYALSPFNISLFLNQLFPKWLKFNSKTNSQRLKFKLQRIIQHSALYTIAYGTAQNISLLIVRSSLNAYETGILSGMSTISLFISLISGSLTSVLSPRVSRYKLKTDLNKYFKKALALSLTIAFGFIVFIPLAKYLVLFTIGSAYLEGLPILLILIAAAFTEVITVPFAALFYASQKNHYFTLSGVILFSINIIGNLLFVNQFGLQATAYSRLIARLIILIITFIWGVREIKKIKR